jgi:superfamily II DNA or RNA helicase
VFPDEYAARLGLNESTSDVIKYEPIDSLFDYQRDITKLALEKGKFAVFADCGLGKTLILLEFARNVLATLRPDQIVLVVSPLMVIPQTIEEAATWYGDDIELERVVARDLAARLNEPRGGIVITNYDALTDDVQQGNVAALILDESSMLKSHYGKWASHCLRVGTGLRWKLALTGTPAPNDRIEYANHAVFLDAFPTVNSFLAKFFVNKGQTSERWVLKQHALRPFYRALSHWCIFLTNPATYGWVDGCDVVPPIHLHQHEIPLTDEQQSLAFGRTGRLFADEIGGIENRSVLSQIAKGSHKGKPVPTNKPAAIRRLVESWPDESTIIWCRYNAEQDRIAVELPDAATVTGTTPEDERMRIVEAFKHGRIRTLITKPKILGFGLNLQIATRQIFSGLQDSYEEFYQAVKRSNRIGSTRPLNVHIPITDIERPMIDNVMRKMHMVQRDTDEQERIFKEASHGF